MHPLFLSLPWMGAPSSTYTESMGAGEPYYDRLGRSGTGYGYIEKPTAAASEAAPWAFGQHVSG